MGSPKCWRPRRAPRLRKILVFFCFWIYSNIWANWDPARPGTCSEPWTPWSSAHAHCWCLAQLWDQPFTWILFPCARTASLLFPGAPSAVGCQRTCQEKKIPCWHKGTALVSGVCAPCQAERHWGLLRTAALCPFHTQKNPWTPSTNSTNSI